MSKRFGSAIAKNRQRKGKFRKPKEDAFSFDVEEDQTTTEVFAGPLRPSNNAPRRPVPLQSPSTNSKATLANPTRRFKKQTVRLSPVAPQPTVASSSEPNFAMPTEPAPRAVPRLRDVSPATLRLAATYKIIPPPHLVLNRPSTESQSPADVCGTTKSSNPTSAAHNENASRPEPRPFHSSVSAEILARAALFRSLSPSTLPAAFSSEKPVVRGRTKARMMKQRAVRTKTFKPRAAKALPPNHYKEK